MRAVDTPVASEPRVSVRSDSGPVLLATLGAPFDEQATRIAVDAAVESGLPLIVANVVQLPPLPLSVALGYDQLDYTREMEESLLAPGRLARALGVEVEQLRVRSPRPIVALVQFVGERKPGLLVFGPDRSRLRRRTYERAARRISEGVSCLVWMS